MQSDAPQIATTTVCKIFEAKLWQLLLSQTISFFTCSQLLLSQPVRQSRLTSSSRGAIFLCCHSVIYTALKFLWR